jgi:PKD repeat protein
VITVSGHIVVSGSASLPTALAVGPETAVTNQPAEFDGGPSSDPLGPNQIAQYHWIFGDGQTETKTEPTTKHAYSTPGSYTVSLTVTDVHGANSKPYTLPVPVTVKDEEPRVVQGLVSGQPEGGVAGARTTQAPVQVPKVRLASASVTVSPLGLLPVTLSCTLGVPNCAGTLTLRALVASGGRHAGKKPKSAAVTLARGSFTLLESSHKTILLHLTTGARSLLARSHVLRAQVTILVRDSVGATHTVQTTVTVRAAAGRSAHRSH